MKNLIIYALLFTMTTSCVSVKKAYENSPKAPIQSSSNKMKINEGEYLKLLKTKKTLTTNIH